MACFPNLRAQYVCCMSNTGFAYLPLLKQVQGQLYIMLLTQTWLCCVTDVRFTHADKELTQ